MDVFCDYRRYGINSKKGRIVGWIKVPQLRFLLVFRLASLYKNNLLKMLCRHYAIKYGYQINPGTRIGKGLYLGHWGSIVVNPLAVLGENCNLAQGVTIVLGNPARIIPRQNATEGYINHIIGS